MSPLGQVLIVLVGVSTINANHLERITSIFNLTSIDLIETDINSNIYVAGTESELPSNGVLYKLNAAKEFIWKTYTHPRIQKMFVASGEYVWIVLGETICQLKHNSTENCFKCAETPKTIFMDGDGNLIYQTFEGVSIFHLEAITPVSIVNLENFNMGDKNAHLVDKFNNVYLAGYIIASPKNFSKIAVIPSDELKSLTPSARLIDGPNSFLQSSPSIMTEFYKHVIIAYNGIHARLCAIERVSPGDLKVLYSQPSFDYLNFLLIKDYLYFLSKTGDYFYINFATLIFNPYEKESYTYDIKQIDRVFKDDNCGYSQVLSDSDGNIYFALCTKMYRLKAGESNVTEIYPFNIERKEYTNRFHSLAMDEEDNLWILGRGELYLLEKESTQVEKMTNDIDKESNILKLNKNSKEILIWSKNGLYVFSR